MRKTSFHPGLLFSFQGPRCLLEPKFRLREAGFFETHCVEGVGNDQAGAYSSVGLERTPDKREVGGSSPPRPTLSADRL